MVTTTNSGEDEVDIIARLLSSQERQVPADVARYILDLNVSDRDRARMHELATRNQEDSLTPAEKKELYAFGKVTTLLSILKSRARRTLGMSLDTDTDTDS